MPENAYNSKTFHYGWYVVAAGTLCIFASLGFGRFALGMLLPAMGAAGAQSDFLETEVGRVEINRNGEVEVVDVTETPLGAARPAGAPPIYPFVFIVIACGAASGDSDCSSPNSMVLIASML